MPHSLLFPIRVLVVHSLLSPDSVPHTQHSLLSLVCATRTPLSVISKPGLNSQSTIQPPLANISNYSNSVTVPTVPTANVPTMYLPQPVKVLAFFVNGEGEHDFQSAKGEWMLGMAVSSFFHVEFRQRIHTIDVGEGCWAQGGGGW